LQGYWIRILEVYAWSLYVFIRADIALSALETFLLNGLHKFTLLTYLLMAPLNTI